MDANKEYKDSFIRALFKQPEKALQLYGDITGKVFGSDTKIEMKTLKNVFLSKLRNDLAFIINDTLVVIIEHQSTLNPNMPLRSLQYILLFYEIYFKMGDALYKEKMIRLPKPEFYMLYNGAKPYPATGILKLSDAFADMAENEKPNLELMVNVININFGANSAIIHKNADLNGYAAFVEKVRRLTAEGVTRADAVKSAVEQCINEGILTEFLNKYRDEVNGMFTLIYDENRAKEVAREEGWEDGREEGFEQGEMRLIEKMLSKGITAEFVAEGTDTPLEKVLSIRERMFA
ncbi:MAG: hypothetical protein LBR83_05410 [Clostridiales bacterium]|nr:hypothetical protein [Clostridiales bacterium]